MLVNTRLTGDGIVFVLKAMPRNTQKKAIRSRFWAGMKIMICTKI